MPVAVTSRVLPPTMLPVFGVDATAQLDAIVNEESVTLMTSKVPLMVGVNEPPETLAIVTLSPVLNPCGTCVVTKQGLLTSRHVV